MPAGLSEFALAPIGKTATRQRLFFDIFGTRSFLFRDVTEGNRNKAQAEDYDPANAVAHCGVITIS